MKSGLFLSCKTPGTGLRRTLPALLLTLVLTAAMLLSVSAASIPDESADTGTSAAEGSSRTEAVISDGSAEYGDAGQNAALNTEEDRSLAEAAFREFLDGKRNMVWNDERVTFHFLSRDDTAADGEEYSLRDLIDKVDHAAKDVTAVSTDSSETEIVSIQYAFLDSCSLPLLTMLFEIKQPVLGLNEVYFIMHYDPDDDKIHLSLAEDRWTKSRMHINKNGIVTYIASLSAFETSFVYQLVTGSGDIHFIFSSFYDNRKVSLSDLSDHEKEICLASYTVPGSSSGQSGTKEVPRYYTLHRLPGGDPVFVNETYINLSGEDPVAALYMEDLEDGIQFLNHPTIMSAVLSSINKLGVTPEAFFADEPEWFEYELNK